MTPSRLSVCLLAALALSAPGPALAVSPPAAAPSPATTPRDPDRREPRTTVPRLEGFYDIATASEGDLKRVNVENAAFRRIRIGDTLDYLTRRLAKPRSVTEKSKGSPGYHQILVYDDFDVRVDANRRISRIRVRASGAWMMRNGLRGLMQDFSETRMRRLLGWNFRRKLKRVYVWPISRSRFAQDEDRARLVRMVQQYYKLPTPAEAEKKIIRAWDTVYIYPDRGLRVRVYSNIPISGLFKADFVLVKPVPPQPAAAPTAARRHASGGAPPVGAASEPRKPAPPAAASGPEKPPPPPVLTPADWPRDRVLEAELARRGVRGVTIQRQGRSLRLRGTVRNDRALRTLYEFIRQKGFGEVDYGVEVRPTPTRRRK